MPVYKGFYTMEEALPFARVNIGHNFEVEEGGSPISTLKANLEMEENLQEEEMERLKEKVSLLESQAVMRELTIRNQQRKISEQERDFDQIIQQNDDLLQRITKHQKTGIPYCNKHSNAYLCD